MECQHHEVATGGQAEIDMRFKPLLQMGDQLVWFKYVLKNVAARDNRVSQNLQPRLRIIRIGIRQRLKQAKGNDDFTDTAGVGRKVGLMLGITGTGRVGQVQHRHMIS